MPKLPVTPVVPQPVSGTIEERLRDLEQHHMAFGRAIKELKDRFAIVEQQVKDIVDALEDASEEADSDVDTDPDDEDESTVPTPPPIEITGFQIRDNGDLGIDETKILTWNEDQMIEVGKWLPEPLRLDAYKGKPREMRRLLLDHLQTYDIHPLEPTTGRQPAAESLWKMPHTLPSGTDGLPTTSPFIGKMREFHVPRLYWRTAGKFLRLHQRAEAFRLKVVEHNLWQCKGYNCHDCVEVHESLDQVVKCAIAENRRKRTPFQFLFTPEDKELMKKVEIPDEGMTPTGVTDEQEGH